MQLVHMGFKGLIIDKASKEPIKGATIEIEGIGQDVYSDKSGTNKKKKNWKLENEIGNEIRKQKTNKQTNKTKQNKIKQKQK